MAEKTEGRLVGLITRRPPVDTLFDILSGRFGVSVRVRIDEESSIRWAFRGPQGRAGRFSGSCFFLSDSRFRCR